MSDGFLGLLIFGYALVGIIATGVSREVLGSWDEVEEICPLIVFWGLIPPCAVIYSVFWSLLWLGRGPVKLIRYWQRPKLPKATLLLLLLIVAGCKINSTADVEKHLGSGAVCDYGAGNRYDCLYESRRWYCIGKNGKTPPIKCVPFVPAPCAEQP